MQVERLWRDGAPDAVGSEPADVPTITIHRPENADGSSMIICPGGGYVFHAEYEAEPVAEWLNTFGLTGIVLRYRLAPRYRHPAPFQDACRAVRLVRERAAEWKLDPKRVGIMGFSAGGHLAAHVSTSAGNHERPDVAVLLYPVITFTEASSHVKTWQNLIGESPPRALIEQLSCERCVSSKTPATFLYHASGDPNVPVENALIYAAALRAAGVAFEAHLYDRVAHGVGLAATDDMLGTWPGLCAAWLRGKGFGR
jgi:acetyl esterase/lipase